MRHVSIGQRQKPPNFSAFHWSPHGCLITIGQHFVTTRVVHLPKRTETSLITESDQSRANHQLLQLCTVRTVWSDSDQAVRAVHSCKSWLFFKTQTTLYISLYSSDTFPISILIPFFLTLLIAQGLLYGLVGCFGLNGPLRQYFSLYRAVSQREGERIEMG